MPTIVYLIMLALSGLFFGIEMCTGKNEMEYQEDFMYAEKKKMMEARGSRHLSVGENIRRLSMRMLDATH